MAVFSEATKERIRAASDIVDVIGAYLPLKRAGANFTGLCPFHKEKTPSFNVNPHKQIFHCFGCHKGGDVFTFVKEYENIGFGDAVRRLADRAKIPIEQDATPGEQQARHLKDQLLEIHEKIAQRWQNCLQNEAAGQVARDYLKKRGVGEEAINLFRIGAAPESWDDTVNWAKSKGYDLALVEKTGLIIRKEETGSHYDRFRGRLMFPICDEQGRVVAFSGRVLSGDEKTAKYVNSPETAIFTKSKIFYGLDKSKRAILDAGFAIICEGQLDLIACFMAGVQNIVAPQGTAFTDQHARILKRYVNEVVLCFDSDNAGQNAAVRSLDHLLASGMAVRVAVVPAPHDPDSFIKAFGGEKYRELINNAKGFFDYFLERLCQQNDIKTDKGRTIVVRSMLEALQKTQNRVVFDKYAHDLTFKLSLSFQSIVDEFEKIINEQPSERIKELPENPQPEITRPSNTEFHLLKLLLLHDELAARATLHLDLNWVSHPLGRQIVEMRLGAQKNGSWSNLAAFLDECDSAEMRNLVTEAATEERSLPNAEKQLADVILKLRNQFLDRQIVAVTQKAGLPEISDSEKIELLHEQKKLREQKKAQLTAAGA
jgi:DNA primase